MNSTLPSPQVKISASNGISRAIIEQRLDQLNGMLATSISIDEREAAEKEQIYLKDLLKRKYS